MLAGDLDEVDGQRPISDAVNFDLTRLVQNLGSFAIFVTSGAPRGIHLRRRQERQSHNSPGLRARMGRFWRIGTQRALDEPSATQTQSQ